MQDFADRPVPAMRARREIPAERCRNVLIALRRIMRATDMHSKSLAKEAGLTIPQIVVLQAIRDLGQVTTKVLSNRVNLSQGTVTTILDRLESRALVERYRSTLDKRIVHTRLTSRGRAVLRDAPPLLHQRFTRAFSSLRRADQDRIVTTLEEVADMMGAGALDAAPLLDTRPANGAVAEDEMEPIPPTER